MIYFFTIVLALASLMLGLYAARQIKYNAEGYFIGGRQLNKWSVGISSGATSNSGFVVVAAVGMGYSMGLSALLYPLAWLFGDLIFWFFFAEKLNIVSRLRKSVTVPELLAEDMKSIRLFAGLIVFTLILVYASAQFLASSKALSSSFGISAADGMYITFVAVIGYCIWGGFRSSVWTDLFQGIWMLILSVGIILWSLFQIGGISDFISGIQAVGDDYVDLTGGQTPLMLCLFFLGFAFAGFCFNASQPQMATRIMAAANAAEVKKSRWIYILFLQCVWSGMCVIGMLARVLIPDLQDGETALPALASHLPHPILTGAVIAGILATIFSSLDSLLLSSASALSLDFGIDSRMSRQQKSLWYRLSIVIVGLLALYLGLFMETTVFQAVIFVISILAASIGTAMIIVILKMPRTELSLFLSILTGLVVALMWRVYGLESMINDGLVGAVAAFFANSLVYYMSKRSGV